MEQEQLVHVIGLYKQSLADCMEEKFAIQALMAKQAKQMQELEQQVQNLMAQLDEQKER